MNKRTIEKLISAALILALLMVMTLSIPLMEWYNWYTDDELRDLRELRELRTGLLVQFPDYSGNPNLSKVKGRYKLEDGSRYHISYRDGLYIGKCGINEYVLGDNLSGAITNGYHNIYVDDRKVVYGEIFGQEREIIGHLYGPGNETEEEERKEKEAKAKRKSREIAERDYDV